MGSLRRGAAMRRLVSAVVGWLALALTAGPASAGRPGVRRPQRTESRVPTADHRPVATASWTTCPQPALGAACTDTVVLAFDSVTREGALRERGPVVRTLTFVYRVVDGELGTRPRGRVVRT